MAVHGKCSANVGGRCHLIKASKAGSRIKGAFMKDYTNISQKQRRNHSRASRETKKWEVRSWRNHLVQTVLFLDHMSVYLLGSSSADWLFLLPWARGRKDHPRPSFTPPWYANTDRGLELWEAESGWPSLGAVLINHAIHRACPPGPVAPHFWERVL